ncbi:hypothetical protein M405DRAFT_889719 [Rhizopogon salebrosus TDB-379]|nr:hypothetical protein M405DRAFT_889719 [Rhizopogon salebrosus TDB-379]
MSSAADPLPPCDSGTACWSDGLSSMPPMTQQCYRVNVQLPLQIVAQHAAQMVCDLIWHSMPLGWSAGPTLRGSSQFNAGDCYRVNIQLPLQIVVLYHDSQMICWAHPTWLKAVQWSCYASDGIAAFPCLSGTFDASYPGTHGMPPTVCRPSMVPMVCHPSIFMALGPPVWLYNHYWLWAPWAHPWQFNASDCYRVNIQLTLQIVAQHAARMVCQPYITWLKPVQCRPLSTTQYIPLLAMATVHPPMYLLHNICRYWPWALSAQPSYAANGMPPSHRAHVPTSRYMLLLAVGSMPPMARACRSIATLWYLMPGHPWHLANDMPAIHYMGYGPDPTVSLDQHSSPTPDSGTACWSDGWQFNAGHCYRVNVQLPLQIVAQHAARIVCWPYITWLKPVQCHRLPTTQYIPLLAMATVGPPVCTGTTILSTP